MAKGMSKTSVASSKAIIKGGKVNDEAIMKKSGEQKSKSAPVKKDAKPKYPKVKGL